MERFSETRHKEDLSYCIHTLATSTIIKTYYFMEAKALKAGALRIL
jgi:hypothetical protein